MTADKQLLKDLNSQLRERWNETTEPVREWWSSRTWWLRWSKWEYALKQLLPSVSRFRRKIHRYRESNRIWKEFERIASRSDYFNRMSGRNFLPSVMVYFRIENDLTDIRVPMELLFDRGWEVKSTDDSSYRRRYTLEHEDYDASPVIIASIAGSSACEIIEHEEEVVETKKSYEIVCEGESELTGRV